MLMSELYCLTFFGVSFAIFCLALFCHFRSTLLFSPNIMAMLSLLAAYGRGVAWLGGGGGDGTASQVKWCVCHQHANKF